MNGSRLPYYVVDAFTNRPFTGNSAAVVPLDAWRDPSWLQNVAMEMNLAETAFLVPNEQGYDLRWFSPKVEVDLCGHATLASAIVLAHLGKLADGVEVAFSTKSGVLKARRAGSQIQLDFPILPDEATEPPPGLLASLNIAARYVGRSKFDFLVEVDSEDALCGIAPDFKQLAALDCRGVIVTARSDDSRLDFVSRFFAPALGIDEDPVTGSAHCCLAPYWASVLGKTQITAFQASARGGVVQVRLLGNRVILGGQAVTVWHGELLAVPDQQVPKGPGRRARDHTH